jgi:hypothetical protein
MPPDMMPIFFSGEFIYSFVIVMLCFLIYGKTKEFYNLTGYKGIEYFRISFLFLGLSYGLRFILHMSMLVGNLFDFFIPREFGNLIFIIPVGYLSTMGILYLTYSLIWKKINERNLIIFSNIISIFIALIPLLFDAHFIVPLLQLIIVIIAIIINIVQSKKMKKLSNIRIIYSLIFIFWIINLIQIGPRRLFNPEFKVISQIISLFIFILLYHKMNRWIK